MKIEINNYIELAKALGDASRHKPDRCAAISLMASAIPLRRLRLVFTGINMFNINTS
jgi:hypothetical protein